MEVIDVCAFPLQPFSPLVVFRLNFISVCISVCGSHVVMGSVISPIDVTRMKHVNVWISSHTDDDVTGKQA